MRYDYDMYSLIPDEVQSEFQGMFNDLGVSEMMSQQSALWRDPAVVEALMGADQSVKDLFRNAGFGINMYESGAPEGRFFERDTAARQQLEDTFLDVLAERLDDGSLDGANWNGFDLEAFLEYLETARPIDEVEVAQEQAAAFHASQAKSRKKMFAMIGLGIGVMVMGYVLAAVLMQPPVVANL